MNTTLSEESLEEMMASLKDIKDPITIKPTQIIIPGPVRQWMHETGRTYQDVLDMVAKATKGE